MTPSVLAVTCRWPRPYIYSYFRPVLIFSYFIFLTPPTSWSYQPVDVGSIIWAKQLDCLIERLNMAVILFYRAGLVFIVHVAVLTVKLILKLGTWTAYSNRNRKWDVFIIRIWSSYICCLQTYCTKLIYIFLSCSTESEGYFRIL